MFVIGFSDKPMKMMAGFRPYFGLNIEFGRCPAADMGWKGAQPLTTHTIYQWPWPSNLVGSWNISLTVKPNIVVVAGANLQWGRFVSPSCYPKRENTALELSTTSKLVARSSTSHRKGASDQNMCGGAHSVGNGKNRKTCSVHIRTHSDIVDLVAIVFSPNVWKLIYVLYTCYISNNNLFAVLSYST